jgi:hypothetical protein
MASWGGHRAAPLEDTMKDALIRTITGARPLRETELGEFLSLAAEIQAAEGLTVNAALDAAAKELDDLRYYQLDWDRSAANAGNWDTIAGAIPF